MELVKKMLAGSQQPLARLITMVEREAPEVPEIMRQVYPHTGKAYCIGVTGPPGAGKSTLVDKLTSGFRKKGLSVGIIAVDPTSPFSGGAVLGDRIRMQQHYLDSGVFIRSMATRGSHGGLPKTAKAVVKLLDAFGKDIIIVETVGVGQTELDIMEAADTTVVVLVPEAGDAIQTMKAGLMEIAHIMVVNKADREGADYLVCELEAMVRMGPKRSDWLIPVLATQAAFDVGIDALMQEIEHHRVYLKTSGELEQRRCEQRKSEFIEIVEQRIKERLLNLVENDGRMSASVLRVKSGDIDPYSAAQEILENRELLREWLGKM
ncbi:MAG: methylmalonyl Co-A mutase-associated GTPase MeaB [Dehalococcoidia bacterium]|nr:methylmalonyl Co-A mutase-associated GTPase MeaB [Dehalococcoidia bacterium]